MKFEMRPLRPEWDAELAALIRARLEEFHLDIPGTAYFDEALNHLSRFYDRPGRAYFAAFLDGELIGGVGLAECDGMEDCCEMQKLYLCRKAEGQGLGARLVAQAERQAREMGYRRIYLETHSCLRAAVHLYEKSGYRRIPRPESVVHSTMDLFFRKELGAGTWPGEGRPETESGTKSACASEPFSIE